MKNTQHAQIVIVGAGHAGVQLTATLAQAGFDGTIMVLERETTLPYHRPPLSKAYFQGEASKEDLLLRQAEYWQSSNLTLVGGAEVVEISPAEQSVMLSDGQSIRYDHLVWAAGGQARRIPVPGAELAGVCYIRTLVDADKLREGALTAKSVAIVGGGYIGLEAAASLHKAGLKVTLIEASDRLLQRATGRELSSYLLQQHTAKGIDIRLGAVVAGFRGQDRVEGVTLADGSFITAELVVVGIGLQPEIGPLQRAGAQTGNGVYVDKNHCTSLSNIYAIGDCAAFETRFFTSGGPIRIESVPNASENARLLAAHLTGSPQPERAVPWFWSDQFDIKLKTAGLLTGYTQEILRGSPETGKFSVAYLKGNRLIALDAVNQPAEFAQAKALIEADAMLDPQKLINPMLRLKDCISEEVPPIQNIA